MTPLARKLGLIQAIGLSISIIAPAAAMALNVSLTAQAAGPAAPLAFAIGTVVMTIVGVSFVAISDYLGHTFGRRCGFISGWTLLLAYLAYAGGVSALVGRFLQAAMQNIGLHPASSWAVFGSGSDPSCHLRRLPRHARSRSPDTGARKRIGSGDPRPEWPHSSRAKDEVLPNMTPAHGHRNRSPQAVFTEMSNDR
jgi:hypothetical protein